MATLKITTDIPQETVGEVYQCSECKDTFFMDAIPDYCPMCGIEIGSPSIENPRDDV
jgi:rubrerythrin